MKTLSLKLDDNIFEETEKMTSKLHLARNRYINEALSVYNLFNKRRLLKKQLSKESTLVSKDSMDILAEFEKLIDGN
jgi:predicted transcriptional regulator